VTVTLAFDGWPVELVDTAGLRDTPDLLEREGVARTKAAVAQADLCVWLHDATTPAPQADELRTQLALPPERFLWVNNKTDLAPATHGLGIAATTGAGLADLLAAIVQRLVPYAPLPGEPVPYTPELCARAEQECNKPSQ
jgi:tRNA modification GTPase